MLSLRTYRVYWLYDICTWFYSGWLYGGVRLNAQLVHQVAPLWCWWVDTSNGQVAGCPWQRVIEVVISSGIVSDGGTVRPLHGATAVSEDSVCWHVVCDDNGLECVGLWWNEGGWKHSLPTQSSCLIYILLSGHFKGKKLTGYESSPSPTNETLIFLSCIGYHCST